MRLGERLVSKGWITPAQLEDALSRQRTGSPGRRLGDILREIAGLSDAHLVAALAEEYGVPSVLVIDDAMLDPELLRPVPVEWARAQGVIPGRLDGRTVAFLEDPAGVGALHDLGLLLGEDFTPVLAPPDAVRHAIERAYFRKPERAPESLGRLAREAAAGAPAAEGREEDLLRSSEEAPVAGLVNAILLDAVRQGASDIHLEPFRERLLVRFRIDGFLHAQPSPPRPLEAALVSRLKVMARLDIAERRLPQDGMATVRVGEQAFDIRLSTVPVAEGERVVLRLLHRASIRLSLSDLGMPPDTLARFRELLVEPHGVILVTGPTGSGKTTTLYAALRELDTQRLNIMTIEDPIEYQLPDIGQIQVRPKIGLTFSQGLRHILRQDPDIVFVGEIRDAETAEIAIRASLTGHLVLATLHTNDAVTAVVRLADMGVEPYLLASAIRGSLAQRLVRRLCPACRRLEPAAETDGAWLRAWSDAGGAGPFGVAAGCPACREGYRGRTGLFELYVPDAAGRESIRRGASPAELREPARRAGQRLLIHDGLAKAAEGVTSLAELRRAVGRPDFAI